MVIVNEQNMGFSCGCNQGAEAAETEYIFFLNPDTELEPNTIDELYQNMGNLRRLGAFGENAPELYKYDQFVNSEEYVREILNGDRIDVFTDDGNHSEKAIMTTLESVAPHLNERFVYFVEDNWEIHRVVEQEHCNGW